MTAVARRAFRQQNMALLMSWSDSNFQTDSESVRGEGVASTQAKALPPPSSIKVAASQLQQWAINISQLGWHGWICSCLNPWSVSEKSQ